MIFVEIILLIYFGYTTAYSSILFIAGLFYRDKDLTELNGIKYSRFCVFIPAYKEDGVIVSVAKASLNQKYPKELYSVVVVADSLKDETVELLKTLPIQTIVVNFSVSTKMKSLNEAFSRITGDFDYAVILDADNIMEPEFLLKANKLHKLGYRSIQGQRIAKNDTTTMAVLDGISEAINYSIISKGSSALGASPGVKGSGMSFEFEPIKKIFSGLESVGGFDRELELKLIENGMPIYYSEKMQIKDEKVGSIEVFKRQRTRWISSQFFYLRKYFLSGIRFLFKGNLSYFNSAVLRNIQLPRLINTGLLAVITFVLFFFRSYLFFGFSTWILIFIVNCLVILLSIPRALYTKKMLAAFLQLPGVFINMFLLLFKLKGANKKFIHTPHEVPASPKP